ncbi:MAG: MOSC domain-containing protein [Kangiellaceae bacterium]|nr:MOSC domain-containing protein [Kangiellaceae bacterium]
MNNDVSLSEIIIYPIKSLAGISLSNSEVNLEGLKQDRMMMLVDDSGLFITQRKFPQLALLNVASTALGIKVSMPDSSSVEIEEESFLEEKIDVRIWKDNCVAFVASNEINLWFSQFLTISVRLIKYDHSNPRATDQEYSKPGDIVSFADGFPLLVIAQSSLDDLNRKLDIAVSMKNFRPNLVVNDSDAFAEDKWKQVKIGEVVFDAVKMCSRCIMTTVNPHNGRRSEDGEPYKTLSGYREISGKVCLGMNLIPRNKGILSLGESIQLID